METLIDSNLLSQIYEWLIILGTGSAVFIGIISIIFEVTEIIFILTPSEKDDIWLAKVRVKWGKWKPFLEWFHIKTPLVKVLDKIRSRLEAIKNAIIEFRKAQKEKKLKLEKKNQNALDKATEDNKREV